MEKLDRLGWAAGMAVTTFGIRVGIRVNRPEVLDHLPPLFPPGWRPQQSRVVDRLYSLIVPTGGPGLTVRRFSLLYGDLNRLARTTDPEEVFGKLRSDLKLYVADATKQRVFIHAGVVGWRGRAILIPGRSLSGKSTLVASLIRAGATYYSDEFAVLDPQGRVHPYVIPLSLREHGPTAAATMYPVEAIGGRAGVRSLPVGLVVVTRFRPEARWRPRPLSPGEGALALLANALSARARPAAVLATVQQIVSRVAVLKGPRGEADEVAPRLLQAVGAHGSRARRCEPWRPRGAQASS